MQKVKILRKADTFKHTLISIFSLGIDFHKHKFISLPFLINSATDFPDTSTPPCIVVGVFTFQIGMFVLQI